jgi:hypothetical protein
VYFAAKEADKPEAGEFADMVAAKVFKLLTVHRLLAPGPRDLRLPLVPLLDSDDPKILEVAAEYFYLGCQIEGDFVGLGPFLHDKEAAPPRGLIRFLFADPSLGLFTDPGMGLRSMIAQYLRNATEDRKPILWGEHVIADTIWRHQNGFLEKNRVDPAAAEQADKLSRHDRWWVRLYVAAVLRDHPAFRTKVLVDRLARDPNDLVKQTVKDFLAAREEPAP